MILVMLAVVHFVYQGILLPSFRLRLRYKLFRARDELRKLKIIHGEKCNSELFVYLQGSINNTIRILHRIDLVTLFHVESVLKDHKELRRQIEKRGEWLEKQLNQCQIEELKTIHETNLRLFSFALLANNGGLLLYLLPIAILVVILLLMTKQLRIKVGLHVEKEAEKVVLIPESQLGILVPAYLMAT